MPAKIDFVKASTFTVPTDQPEADGTLEWDATTVVVVMVGAAGAQGTGWAYTSAAAAQVVDHPLSGVAVGSDPFDVGRIHERAVRAVRNLGRPGVVAAAISALDIALWDLKARLLGVSLVDLFGPVQGSVPVYGSGGFTTYDEPTLASQLEGWVGQDGTAEVKIKIGESWGTNPSRDIQRVEFARRVIGEDVGLMVDANGGYSIGQARRMGQRMFDVAGICWFEEPVSSDDLPGLKSLREVLEPDIAAGEYGYDEAYFARMVDAGAVDCLQIDVTRCGGFTSWLRAAALAGARNLDVSGHCCPSLHAHVAAAVPNLRHVEFFHDHQRVDGLLFDGTLRPADGRLSPDPDRPGHGMTLRTDEAEKYRVA